MNSSSPLLLGVTPFSKPWGHLQPRLSSSRGISATAEFSSEELREQITRDKSPSHMGHAHFWASQDEEQNGKKSPSQGCLNRVRDGVMGSAEPISTQTWCAGVPQSVSRTGGSCCSSPCSPTLAVPSPPEPLQCPQHIPSLQGWGWHPGVTRCPCLQPAPGCTNRGTEGAW